jgi:hypothetical protein
VCQRPPAQRSATQSTGDAWPAPMVGTGTGLSGVHRTVSGAPTATNLQRSSVPEKEIDPHRTVYIDCPVVHRTVRCTTHPTEGNFGLPCWPPTTASYLGAIKGTPRRMEESPKHSRDILSLQDSNFTHLIL